MILDGFFELRELLDKEGRAEVNDVVTNATYYLHEVGDQIVALTSEDQKAYEKKALHIIGRVKAL